MSDHMLDRLALIVAAAERQREIDNSPCPICGGDMLRRDFTAGAVVDLALAFRCGDDQCETI